MNATEFELVIQAAADQEIHNDGEWEAIDAARADLAAMQTPITADVVWELGFVPDIDKFGGEIFVRHIDPNLRIEVSLLNDTVRTIHMERSTTFPGCRNMYRLGQLVELLGGAK